MTTDGRPAWRRPPLLVPAALATAALLLLPAAYLVIRAAESSSAWEILTRRQTLEVILRTGLLVTSVTAAAIAIGVPLAWILTRTDIPLRRTLGVLAAMPLVVPSYVAALVLLGAFSPRGLLQQLLEGPFGVEHVPDVYGFPGALLALTLSTYPYVFILVAAALRTADPAIEEAARALGRSPLRAFLGATLPSLRPSIAAGGLLVALYTLSDFGAVSLMQYDVLTRAVFLRYRALFDRAPAAGLALVLVALTVVILVGEYRARGRARYYRSTPGTARRAPLVALGRWRYLALAFCASVIGAFLLVPLAVLGYWLADALERGQQLGFVWEASLDSLSASALTATVVALAVIPLALLPRRHPRRWARVVQAVGYVPNALPGVVVALSLVFFATRVAEPVYQTLALLVFAYAVRFFPEALAATTSSLDQVSPRLEEAARGLGRSPTSAFVTVTAPLARRGLLAGAALVFLSTMKELPATLILKPIGFDTLATEVWRYTSLGFYSRAAFPALILIACSVPVLLFLSSPSSAVAPD